MAEMKIAFICAMMFLVIAVECTSPLRFYFEQLDNDKNEEISFTEWKKAYQDEEDFLHNIGEEDALIAFRYSTMGDNIITWEEFHKQFRSLEKSNHTSPEQIHLSIRDPTSFFVIWVTKYETYGPPMVKLGKSPTNDRNCEGASLSIEYTGEMYTYSVGPFGWQGYINRVSLTNLQTPSQYYCYQVGNKINDTTQNWSEVYSFHTQQSSPTNEITRMAVYGDMGTIMPLGFAVSNQIIADSLEFGHFDLFQHAGDVAYGGIGGDYEFQQVWDLYGNQIQPFAAYSPYMTTLGNHEEYYNCSAFLNRYAMPGLLNGNSNFYYSYDYGNVHVISMSTEKSASYLPGSEQYEWLVKDLEMANANRAATPWIFLFGHRPMYSSDQDFNTSPNLQLYIEPLLKQYNVDLCIWGHMHEYERTYPVYDNIPTQTPRASSKNPTVTTYLNPNSTTHLTIGTSGAMIIQRWVRPAPSWSAFRIQRYGYGQLTVYNSTHLEFTFNQMKTREVLDDLWIIKNV